MLNKKLPLRGVIPPLVTPLLSDDEIDEEGLKNLIEHLISGGVHGLFLLGTTGEATSLKYNVREKLIKKACEINAGRIPVLVGITDTSFEDSINMTERFKEAGADAVVIAPPYYIPISQLEMMQYLEDLVPKLALPFFLYNMPGYTKLHMSLETVQLAKDLGGIGVKDSSGDMVYLYSLIDKFRDSPEFSIFAGTEIFLPGTIIQGGHGVVPGGANMFPRLFVDMYEASAAGNIEKIQHLHKIMMRIYNTIYSVGKTSSKYTLGIKCALSVMGICNDYAAHPLRKFDNEKSARMKQYVEEIQEQLAYIY